MAQTDPMERLRRAAAERTSAGPKPTDPTNPMARLRQAVAQRTQAPSTLPAQDTPPTPAPSAGLRERLAGAFARGLLPADTGLVPEPKPPTLPANIVSRTAEGAPRTGIARDPSRGQPLPATIVRPEEPNIVSQGAGGTFEPTVGHRFENAANEFSQEFTGQMPAATLEGIAVLAKELDAFGEYEGKDAEDLATARAAERVRQWAEENFPTDPALRSRFLDSVLPRAFGSGASFMLGGVAGRAMGASGAAVSGTAGALAGAGGAYREAKELGATEEEARTAGVLNVPLGASEAIPVERALDRATGGMTGTLARRLLRSAASGAAEEAIQETGQTIGGNVVAREIYDPERPVMEGVKESAGAGAIVGSVLSGSVQTSAELLERRRRRIRGTGAEDAAGQSPMERLERRQQQRAAPPAEPPAPPAAGAAPQEAEQEEAAREQEAEVVATAIGTLRRIRRTRTRPGTAPVDAETEAEPSIPRYQPSAGGAPPPVAFVPTTELHRDPERFQYKATGAEGVTAELKRVRTYNPKLGGIILAWKDPADGKTYVVNGHHRHELAERTEYPEMLVRYINSDARTAEEARAIGALANIAEGRGTAVDAAKLIRDRGISPQDLEREGISLSGRVAKDGLSLANLASSVFDRVARGEMTEARGAIVGSAGLSEAQQVALVQMVEQQEEAGKKILDRDVAELARFVAGAGEQEATQETLFGTETETRSLAIEKASLSAYIRDRLGRERRTFGFVSKGDRADQLEQAGAGKIDRTKSEEIARLAAQAEEIYAKESIYSGPVSQALNEAARELAANPRNARAIRDQLYERVRGLVGEVLSGEQASGAPERAVSDPGGGDRAAGAGGVDPTEGESDIDRMERLAREAEEEPAPSDTDLEAQGQNALFERRARYGRPEPRGERVSYSPQQIAEMKREIRELTGRDPDRDYGLSDPADYAELLVMLRAGQSPSPLTFLRGRGRGGRLNEERPAYGRLEPRMELLTGEVTGPKNEGFIRANRLGRVKVEREWSPMPNEPWAIDNGAFRQFNAARKKAGLPEVAFIEAGQPGVEYNFDRFERALREWAERYPDSLPVFAAVPDQVAAGPASLQASLRWLDDFHDRIEQEFGLDQMYDPETNLRPITDSVGDRMIDAPWYLVVQDGITPEMLDAPDPTREGAKINERFLGIFLGGSKNWKRQTAAEWRRYTAERGMNLHYGRVSSRKELAFAHETGADSADSTQFLWSQRERQRFTRAHREEGRVEQGRLLEDRAPYRGERLTSAALRYRGDILTGGVHADIYEQLEGRGVDLDDGGIEAGFVTSNDRFVGYEEAGRIARAARQWEGSDPFDRETGLLSEDLFPAAVREEGPDTGWPFILTSSKKVGGGSKTRAGDQMEWEGSFADGRIRLRTRVRNIDAMANFMVPSNARIHFQTRFPQYVDIEVLDRPGLTDEELEQLARMAAAADGRPASARLKGEPVRTRPIVPPPAARQAPSNEVGKQEETPADGDQLRLLEGRAAYVREQASLFGDPEPAAAPSSSDQGSMFAEPRGPQGRTAALTEARQTVSLLEGRAARGAARPSEIRRLESARALIRALEGQGMAPEDVARATAEMEGERPAMDPNVGDLFGGTIAEPRSDYGGEQIAAVAWRERSGRVHRGEPGEVHADLYRRIRQEIRESSTLSRLGEDLARLWHPDQGTDGFVTTEGRFVGRDEALRIAKAARQWNGRNRMKLEPSGEPGLMAEALREGRAAYGVGTFYSRLQRAIENAPFEKAPAKQWAGYLGKQPIAAGEREWVGIDEELDAFNNDDPTGTLTKAELLGFAQERGVQLGETVLGATANTAPRGWRQLPNGEWVSTGQVEWRIVPGEFEVELIDPEGLSHLYDSVEEAKQGALEFATDYEPAKFAAYTLPGGSNYRELLITLDSAGDGLPDGFSVFQAEDGSWGIQFPDGNRLGGWRTREAALQSQSRQSGSKAFLSSHFEQPNILAHVRLKDRNGPNGETVLFVEEIQSDWHQMGRREGYQRHIPAEERARLLAEMSDIDDRLRDIQQLLLEAEARVMESGPPPATGWGYADAFRLDPEWNALVQEREDLAEKRTRLVNDSYVSPLRVPDAPFKKTDEWVGLAARRVIEEAVRGGYDRISWTTGIQNAERYDLSKQVDLLEYDPKHSTFRAYKDGHHVHVGNYDAKALPDVVGKEIAEKLLAQPVSESGYQELEGVDLKVGGQGMIQFYDRIVPKAFQDAAKKLGVKVQIEPLGGLLTELPEGFRVERDPAYESVRFRVVDERQPPEGALHEYRGVQVGRSGATRAEATRNALDIINREAAELADNPSIFLSPELRSKVLQDGQVLWEKPPQYPEPDTDFSRAVAAVSARRASPELSKVQRDLFDEDAGIAFGSTEEAEAVADEVLQRAKDLADFTPQGVPTARNRLARVDRRRRRAWVDIRGQSVRNREDIQRLLFPFRSARAERFHVLLLDDNDTILSHTMETSGAIDYVQLAATAEGLEQWHDRIASRARRLGATRAIIAHNHPSGDPTPSREDRAMTQHVGFHLQARGIDLLGQYVINHSRGTWLYLDPGIPTIKDVEISISDPPDAVDWNEGKLRLHSPTQPYLTQEDIAAGLVSVSAEDRVDVLYLSTQMEAVAIEPHSPESIASMGEWLPGRIRGMAANYAVIVTGKGEHYKAALDATNRAADRLRRMDGGLPTEGVLDILHIDQGSVLRAATRAASGTLLEVPVLEMKPLRRLFERGGDYGTPSEVPEAEGELDRSGGRPGNARSLRAGRQAGRDAGRVREEAPPELAGVTRKLIQARRRPKAHGAADFASTAAEALIPTERREATDPSGRTLRPIAPVELARIATELLGGRAPFVKKYARWRGAFYPDPNKPKIGLNVELGRDYEQFVHTLAHEVGHLIDYLPDADMARGNILGRLASLKTYLAETIDAAPTDPSNAITPEDRKKIRREVEKAVGPKPPKDEEADLAAWREEVSARYAERIQEEIEARGLLTREAVHEELRALSEWWRPYDPENDPPHYIRYRESSPEIYADAMSVLLNSPGSMQQRAPIFFEAFFAYMGRKPDVQGVYEEIQDLIGEGEEAVAAARTEELRSDFRRGEEIMRQADAKKESRSLAERLKQAFVDRSAPVADRERKRLGKVAAHDAGRSVEMALEELQHADNVNRTLIQDVERLVDRPLREAGVTEEDVGEYLMLQRIAEGDRGGMAENAKAAIMEATGEDTWPAARAEYLRRLQEEAERMRAGETVESELDPDLLQIAETGVLNPHGYTPEEAKRQLQALEQRLSAEPGAERWRLLEEKAQIFRDLLFKSVDEAVRVGTMSRAFYETKAVPNRHAYVPFSVLDYFNGTVPAGVRQQIGTLKGVANPYTTALLKAMALNRLNEWQKAKVAVVNVLDVDFPGMAGPVQPIDRFHPEKRPGKGRDNIIYHRDGKLYYREVDEYVAKVLQSSDLGAAGHLAKTLGSKGYALFHPLYVSLSLAWQLRNPTRDWKRTFRNLSSAHRGKPAYKQAVQAALDIGRLTGAYAKTAGPAWRHARRQYDPFIRQMLDDKALGRAFHSFTPREDDAKLLRLMQEYGMRPVEEKGVKAAAKKLGRGLATVGVFQETWSKAAAYRVLGDLGILGRSRAYATRNYFGTPDSTKRGHASESVNAVMMYANVVMAGLRADAEVGLDPKSAPGFWLRSVLIDFAPKAAMAAAAVGFFGDDAEEWMARIPSYDKEKYIIIPVPGSPWSTNAAGDRKAVYVRFPHDDLNRMLAGAVWALFMEDRPHRIPRTLAVLQGEFPGLAPWVSMPLAWAQAAIGRNPFDTFRGRNMVPQTEWDAGGWHRFKGMLRHTLGEFGLASQLLDAGAGALEGMGLKAPSSPLDTGLAPGEAELRSIPGVSSIVKVSDRGLSEQLWYEEDWERRERAKLRADLPEVARRASQERSRLNRFGDEKLPPHQRARRRQLNTWYRRSYLPLTAAMERARDTKDPAAYERAKATLERASAQLGQRPTVRR